MPPPSLTLAAPAETRVLAVAALTFNALVWGLSWWPFRALDGSGLQTLWATALVYAVGAGGVLLWRPSAWREVAANRGLWLLGAASGLTNAAFNWGVTIGEVIRVVLLFYLMPVWAALLARALLHERLDAAAALRIALALAGAATVMWSPVHGWPAPRSLADWLGVAGGFGFALTNVLLRREAASSDPSRALAMFAGAVLLPGAVACVLAGAGVISWVPAPRVDWIGGTLALALAFIAGNFALQYGAARLPATVTAVVLLTEVVFASVSAAWLGHETLGARTLAGGTLIIASALMAAVRPERRRAA